jgi:hypothetical protein
MSNHTFRSIRSHKNYISDQDEQLTKPIGSQLRLPPVNTFNVDASDRRSDYSNKTAVHKGSAAKINPWLIQHRYNKSYFSLRTPIKESTNEPSESPSPAVMIFRENADIRIRKGKGDN